MNNLPPPLSADIKGSFAYFTVKDRLPVILTSVIDHLCRKKLVIYEEYGKEVSEDIKVIVGQLSQLKNEMQTNKLFKLFSQHSEEITDYDDNEMYNNAIQLYKDKHEHHPQWFTASWLFAECYLYKRIDETFKRSQNLKFYDPFFHQKKDACERTLQSIQFLSEFMVREVMQCQSPTEEHVKIIILQMLQVCLWGNQCDLSISSGASVSKEENPLLQLEATKERIICSEGERFWHYLRKIPQEDRSIGFVMDNAGFELFADLCFATALMKFHLASSFDLYIKTRPWFVSDTTRSDFNWTLEYLREQGGAIAKMSSVFSKFIEDGLWTIKEHKFWTGPSDFAEMKTEAPDLYAELSGHSLVIFKGDLNYRKLVGDLDWPNDTPFRTALRGFTPSCLLVLRTIKGGPVVHIDERSPLVRKAKAKEDWFSSGEIGLIQFVDRGRSWTEKIAFWIVGSVSILIISLLFKRFVL